MQVLCVITLSFLTYLCNCLPAFCAACLLGFAIVFYGPGHFVFLYVRVCSVRVCACESLGASALHSG